MPLLQNYFVGIWPDQQIVYINLDLYNFVSVSAEKQLFVVSATQNEPITDQSRGHKLYINSAGFGILRNGPPFPF